MSMAKIAWVIILNLTIGDINWLAYSIVKLRKETSGLRTGLFIPNILSFRPENICELWNQKSDSIAPK